MQFSIQHSLYLKIKYIFVIVLLYSELLEFIERVHCALVWLIIGATHGLHSR